MVGVSGIAAHVSFGRSFPRTRLGGEHGIHRRRGVAVHGRDHWLYVSSVRVIVACPSISLMSLTWTSLASRVDHAFDCRTLQEDEREHRFQAAHEGSSCVGRTRHANG